MTVVFCDLVGSTHISRALDPEDWHRLIDRLHTRCGDIVSKHHGYVAQYLGDGLLAYFGYPSAGQDDPHRAVAAGLELAREGSPLATETSQSVRFRIGIHTGPVVVGKIGSGQHRELLALGETPTLAARIQELAPADSVVVSADTQRLVEGFFQSSKLGVFVPKGFSEPITLYRVTGASGPTTRLEAASAAGLTPLVGRDAEAVAMAEAWDLALAGKSPILLLQGEAGIGKSRLIHLLKEQITSQTTRLIEMRCSEHGRSSPFHPLVDYLRREAALRAGETSDETMAKIGPLLARAGLSEQQVALVASLLGVRIPPAQLPPATSLRPALMDALFAWLAGAPEQPPTLFVLEDLHWADPSTLELIGAFVDRSPRCPMLTVLSARPEFSAPWLGKERVRTVQPARLDQQDTRRLIALVARGKSLPPGIAERVAQQAEGIPLFLEEVTKAVLESGVLRETPEGYELEGPISDRGIPGPLQGSLIGRFDQLGPYKAIAQVAAVLGREFGQPLFEAIWRRLPSMPEIDLTKGLDRVAAAQLITKGGEAPDVTYQFKHSLLQEAAYQSLLRTTRREYHRVSAEVMLAEFAADAELRPELVAHHYAAAQMDDQAATYWSRAGQRSIATSAYAEAISQFGAGLKHLTAVPSSKERSQREMDLRVSHGVALITTRGYAAEDVENTYSRAAELCGELGTSLLPRVLYGVWVVNYVRNNLASSRLMVPNLERVAESGEDAASKLVAYAALATWAFWRGQHTKVAEYHASASLLYDAADPKRQHEKLLTDHGFEGLLYPKLYFAWSQVIAGDTVGGLDTWRETQTLGERIQDPYTTCEVLAFGAAIHHDLGHLQIAGELAERAREIAADKSFVFWLALALGHSGLATAARGDSDGGIAKVNECLGIFRNVGVKTTYSYFLCYLAESFLAKGDANAAFEALNQAIEMARTGVDSSYEPEMLRLLGEAHLAQGQLDTARETLSAALELARSQGAKLFELRTATSLARQMRAAGEGPRAKRLLSDVRARFGQALNLPPLRAADEFLEQLA